MVQLKCKFQMAQKYQQFLPQLFAAVGHRAHVSLHIATALKHKEAAGSTQHCHR